MRNLTAIASVMAIVWAAPAIAGEAPLYQPAPAWVQVASLPATRSASPIVLLDTQERLEGGRTWAYTDRAVRIDNPQVLQSAGTVQATWSPDKGDLIIHRVAIIRDGQEIDVLKQGTRFEVLRREQQLEMRTINGLRTATLVLPGLRVGDIFRLTYSITIKDDALAGKAQAVIGLPAKPLEVGFARAIISWPAQEKVAWKVPASVPTAEPVLVGGFKTISVSLPLAKPADVPDDAPLRYHLPRMLQVSNFADWREVSRVMAPLFATKGAIDPSGPIAQQVAAIRRASPDKLTQALAALRLVQDQVAYLANGMNGGNYIPQKPADTWSKRYGDCKAKTLLLLSMLRELGIEAEPLIVASQGGDALPTVLPMPGQFDHIIVHAVIGGTDYWLDGTSSGASMDVIADVPDFAYGLPLRAEGADLMPLPPRAPKQYQTELTLTVDQRAGIDLPALFQAKWVLRGFKAASVNARTSTVSKEQRETLVNAFVDGALGDHWLVDSSVVYDAQGNTATLTASGIVPSGWNLEQPRALLKLTLPSSGFEFHPDRSREAWKTIPVKLDGPDSEKRELNWLLPADKQAYALEGKSDFDEQVATIHLMRHAVLGPGSLKITDSVISPGGELAPEQIADAKAKAARLGSLTLSMRAPSDAERHYRFAGGADRSVLVPLEQAYGKYMANDPEDVSRENDRSSFREWTFDRRGALADLGTVIDKQPSATAYARRARLRIDEGDLKGALADADAAAGLEPGFDSASLQADLLARSGKFDDAIALLEQQTPGEENAQAAALELSDLDAQAGRKDHGLTRIDAALQQRPGDPDLLNARCYYRATWKVQLDGLADDCTDALQRAKWSSFALDSRAMGYFRLGRYQDAVKDLDAALTANPEQTPSLYLRGVVREQMGDKGGKDDIRQALARNPSLSYFYGRFGIKPD